MQDKISIIVPIYKVEPYLRQCIDSIIAQTYVNLEIILVDDGSPDNCGAICDEYAQKDNRIIVVHKANGGVSSARNAGLDYSTGEYIGFVDSDDWIASDMYETLYDNLVSTNSDVSACGSYSVYMDSSISLFKKSEKFIFNSEQAIREIIKLSSTRRVRWALWSKLHKREILKSISFPADIILNEDLLISCEELLKINKIVVDTAPKYYYRERKSSSRSYFTSSEKVKLATESIYKARKYVDKIVTEKYPHLSDMTKALCIKGEMEILAKLVVSKNFRHISETKKLVISTRKNFKFIMKSKYFGKKIKIQAIALQINVILYKWLRFLIVRYKNGNNDMFE